VTSTSAQPSLRALARSLGCSHVALSKRVHAGKLTAGVRLDGRGRVVVVDAAAAADEWRAFHVPGLRMPSILETSRPPPPPCDVLRTVLPDHAMDRAITALELFEERDSHSLLVTALVAIAMDDAAGDGPLALDGPEVAAIRERVAAQLRAVAELHGADAAAVARAEQDLESPLLMLTAADQ
jgi:hypothetical protein